MKSTENEEQVFFLEGQACDSDNGAGDVRCRPGFFRAYKSHLMFFIIHFFLLVCNVALSSRHESCFDGSPNGNFKDTGAVVEAYSPADAAVNYVLKSFDVDSESAHFHGEPSPSVDKAWSNLLKPSVLKLSQDELERMNKTSVAFRDGTGYMGYLESMHMLHCLKRLYQAQHPDYYSGVQTLTKGHAFTRDHLDHCFDILREGIMCNADVNINTYFWIDENHVESKREGYRTCTDWSRIWAWAENRTVVSKDHESLLESLEPDV